MDGSEILIRGLGVQFRLVFASQSQSWKRVSYGEVAVQHVTIPFEDKQITLVGTQSKEGGTKFILTSDKPVERPLTFKLVLEDRD